MATQTNVDISRGLDVLLADYHVLYQKLRNCHWNVTGREFFGLHAKFEELYEQLSGFIDDLAERIRTRGNRPASTLRDYVHLSTLSEESLLTGAEQMVGHLAVDYQRVVASLVNTARTCGESGDQGTANLLEDHIAAHEKTIWMLEAYLA